MPKAKRVVAASLYTIEQDGEVQDSKFGPVQTYGEGGQVQSLEQAFKDFGQLEPFYPKDLRLRLEDGRELSIRHDYHGCGKGGEVDEGRGGIEIINWSDDPIQPDRQESFGE